MRDGAGAHIVIRLDAQALRLRCVNRRLGGPISKYPHLLRMWRNCGLMSAELTRSNAMSSARRSAYGINVFDTSPTYGGGQFRDETSARY